MSSIGSAEARIGSRYRKAPEEAHRSLCAATSAAAVRLFGRATLYKYFPNVETILVAWQDRHVAGHLHHLAEARESTRAPGERLEAVLRAYAQIVHERPHGSELATLVHRSEHVAEADRQLRDFLREVLASAAASGAVAPDSASDELVAYCLHALAAAGSQSSEAAVGRLVTVILAGLRHPLRISTEGAALD